MSISTTTTCFGGSSPAEPPQAAESATAWRIADWYFQAREHKHRPVYHWASKGDYRAVTRAINGGVIGLTDRRRRTLLALEALGGDPILRPGDTGASVRRLQTALARRGAILPIDADYGATTEQAVRRLQQAFGLPETGVADAALWAVLNSKEASHAGHS